MELKEVEALEKNTTLYLVISGGFGAHIEIIEKQMEVRQWCRFSYLITYNIKKLQKNSVINPGSLSIRLTQITP